MQKSATSKAPLLALAGVLLGTLAFAPPSAAFRPTARWILDQAAGKQEARGVRTLKVEQETTLFGLSTAPRGLTVNQRTWLLSPYQVRTELELPEGADVRVHTPQKSLRLRPGDKPRVERGSPDLLASFLAGGPPAERKLVAEQMLKDLGRLKVDTSVVSYARFDGRVVFLVGSKPWEQDKAQVWIDKDTLHLLRVVTLEKRGGSLVRHDVRYLGYGSPEAGAWFPKVIEVYEDAELKLRAVTRGVQKNESLDRALFDVR